MTTFENEYFQKTFFNSSDIEGFIKSANKDLKIAGNSDIPEVVFKFSYDALIKIGITLVAQKGMKVRSKMGHHIKILQKLSQLLEDEDVEIFGDKMRQARNLDLYSGGAEISDKDSKEYLAFVQEVFKKAKKKLHL
ncbi:MAG: hypothetical protein NT099_04215 [Candidatus Saganbacteria bacterium]|nr:hypothetical protein [Candidatus Saganbacteria bacterium]